MSARARALRRRSRTPLLVRLRSLWVVALIALLAAGGAFAAFAGAPQFRPAAVEALLPAGSPVTSDAVLAAAAIDPAANIWLLPLAAIRQRVEAIPTVASAEVRRSQFPQPAVRIAVTVRRPFACLAAGDARVTIDDRARILAAGCAATGVPQLRVPGRDGLQAGATVDDPDLAALIRAERTIAGRVVVRSLGRDRFGGLDVVDGDGVTIRLGPESGLAGKLALVDPIRRSVGRERHLKTIDLRAPATPVVEFLEKL